MIPIMSQDFLVKELQSVFKGFYLKNASGEQSPILVYPQFLPAKTGANDKDHFPHLLVILMNGEDPGESEPNSCTILIMAGTCDKDPNFQGYRDVLNILQKIYYHLMTNRVFQNKYQIEYPIRWHLFDEDTFPYYFGALETTWTVGKITPADTFI